MANVKIGFATVDPSSGNGASKIAVSGERFTGRVVRTVDLKIFNSTDNKVKTIVVEQSPKAEYVTMDDYAIIEQTGGSITINGKSNSNKLNFEYKQGAENPLVVNLPRSYSANGSLANNKENIPGDPGASAEYDFSITISDIPSNMGSSELKGTLTVTNTKGEKMSCELLQVSGKGTFVIHPSDISLGITGEQKTFHVISTTNWSISSIA